MLLVIDANGNPIPTGKGIATADATAVPITSPVTIAAGNTIALKKPKNAAELILKPANTIQVSEKSDMSQYYETDESMVLGVSGTENVYLKNPGSSDVVVSFLYVLL